MLTKATLKAVLYLSENLLQQKAVLLTHVCKVFLDAYEVSHSGSITSIELHLEVNDSTVKLSSRTVALAPADYSRPAVYGCVSTKSLVPCFFVKMVTY